jgi:hypothetical protein
LYLWYRESIAYSFHERLSLSVGRKQLGLCYGDKTGGRKLTQPSKYFPKKVVGGANMVKHAHKTCLGKVTQARIGEQGYPGAMVEGGNG